MVFITNKKITLNTQFSKVLTTLKLYNSDIIHIDRSSNDNLYMIITIIPKSKPANTHLWCI